MSQQDSAHKTSAPVFHTGQVLTVAAGHFVHDLYSSFLAPGFGRGPDDLLSSPRGASKREDLQFHVRLARNDRDTKANFLTKSGVSPRHHKGRQGLAGEKKVATIIADCFFFVGC